MMTVKEKELVAVGISVAAGCKPCTDYHLGSVRKTKATDDEIRGIIAVAVSVRANAERVMENYGLGQLGAARRADDYGDTATDRLAELVSIGAAFAVNCATNLEQHLAAAAAIGITDDEVQAVIRLARIIKAKAATHVKKLVKTGNKIEQVRPQRHAAAAGCG
jgi:AhpD family alkylhydroperoxidase